MWFRVGADSSFEIWESISGLGITPAQMGDVLPPSRPSHAQPAGCLPGWMSRVTPSSTQGLLLLLLLLPLLLLPAALPLTPPLPPLPVLAARIPAPSPAAAVLIARAVLLPLPCQGS